MRVHDQGWRLLPGRSLAQVVVAEIRELQIDHIESLAAQDPVEASLQRRQCEPQPFEAPDRGQGPDLQKPLGRALSAARVRDHHHFAAIGLHRPAALVDVELLVDQHSGGQIVASRKLGHQPVDARLGAKPWWARRHLRDVEDIEAFWAHGEEKRSYAASAEDAVAVAPADEYVHRPDP